MSVNFLEFEKPIAELEAKIEELRLVNQGGEFDLNIEEEITKLREKSSELSRKIFADLGAWQVSQIARHPMRPIPMTILNVFLPNLMNLLVTGPLLMTKLSLVV